MIRSGRRVFKNTGPGCGRVSINCVRKSVLVTDNLKVDLPQKCSLATRSFLFPSLPLSTDNKNLCRLSSYALLWTCPGTGNCFETDPRRANSTVLRFGRGHCQLPRNKFILFCLINSSKWPQFLFLPHLTKNRVHILSTGDNREKLGNWPQLLQHFRHFSIDLIEHHYSDICILNQSVQCLLAKSLLRQQEYGISAIPRIYQSDCDINYWING